METICLNNEMNLTVPEGFHIMDAEEKKKLTFYREGAGECLSDPDRHILISIGWLPIRGFLGAIVSTGDAARDMEKKLGKAMQPYGYRKLCALKKSLDGKEAKGFRYEYEAQGIGMTADALALKRDKTMYYLYIYARTELREESLALWEEILNSIRWAN